MDVKAGGLMGALELAFRGETWGLSRSCGQLEPPARDWLHIALADGLGDGRKQRPDGCAAHGIEHKQGGLKFLWLG